MSSLPAVDQAGYLPKGVHVCTSAEFLERFCTGPHRVQFAGPFEELVQWAGKNHVTSLVIGGTFVTAKPDPNDLDVLVFFKRRADVRLPNLTRSDTGGNVDAQALAEEEVEIAQAYLQLFAADKRDITRGLVQVKLHPRVTTMEVKEQKALFFDVALAGYRGRAPFFSEPSKRLVVPIHGILSNADWIPRFTLFASLLGWAVAPFVYGNQPVTILRNETKKMELVGRFRLWIDEIQKLHDGPISIVAHSFGTYLLGRYLQEAGHLRVPFEGVVLTGSILRTDFPWDKYVDEEAVRMVLNTRSPEDEWVKLLPEGGIRFIAEDALMGKAAVDGFSKRHPRVMESKSSLLTHNNMFEADVIRGIWLPFLEMARLSHATSWTTFDEGRPEYEGDDPE